MKLVRLLKQMTLLDELSQRTNKNHRTTFTKRNKGDNEQRTVWTQQIGRVFKGSKIKSNKRKGEEKGDEMD